MLQLVSGGKGKKKENVQGTGEKGEGEEGIRHTGVATYTRRRKHEAKEGPSGGAQHRKLFRTAPQSIRARTRKGNGERRKMRLPLSLPLRDHLSAAGGFILLGAPLWTRVTCLAEKRALQQDQSCYYAPGSPPWAGVGL